MFLHCLSICPQEGVCNPACTAAEGVCIPACPKAHPGTQKETTTEAGGTHPTGMHALFLILNSSLSATHY